MSNPAKNISAATGKVKPKRRPFTRFDWACAAVAAISIAMVVFANNEQAMTWLLHQVGVLP